MEWARSYIAIEGCIGSGKTTLARVVADAFGVHAELEASDVHPFLEDFYEDPAGTALQTEICFVLIHYHQLRQALTGRVGPVVTDFALIKDRIFASITLAPAERMVFDGVFSHFAELAAEPGLIVYLQASAELLLRRIKLRDRPFEREISSAYLAELNARYDEYFDGQEQRIPILRLPADEYDIVNRDTDRAAAVRAIARAAGIEMEEMRTIQGQPED